MTIQETKRKEQAKKFKMEKYYCIPECADYDGYYYIPFKEVDNSLMENIFKLLKNGHCYDIHGKIDDFNRELILKKRNKTHYIIEDRYICQD